MDHDTTIDALEAELEALLEADRQQSARIDALLARPVAPHRTVRQQLDALWSMAAQATDELDALEREQQQIEAAIDAMGQADA